MCFWITLITAFLFSLSSLFAFSPAWGERTDPPRPLCLFSHQLAQLVGQSSIPSSALVQEIEKRTEKILSLQSQPTREVVISKGIDQQDLVYVYGVPPSIHKISNDGKRVFRHYSEKNTSAILESQSLKAGPRPYIDPYPHIRYEYQDLSGPMFTTPDFPPSELWMGYSEKTDWVEFTLDPRIPVLQCKEGNLLIPTQKNYPSWIRAEYEKYKKTGKISIPNLETEFKRLDLEAGMQPQVEIPIHIIRYQLDGKVFQ